MFVVALATILAGVKSNARMLTGWARKARQPKKKAEEEKTVSAKRLRALAALLRGKLKGPVAITTLDPAYPNASQPNEAGSPGLFPLFWRAR
eukprot:1157648-Pelagomonas_calceolata.AAC.1